MMTRLLAAAAVVSMSTMAMSTPAAADELSFSFDGVFFGVPGQVMLVEASGVDAELVGSECTAVYTTENDASVRQGTDLVIESGGQQIEVLGVEDEAGASFASEGTITLGDTVEISVRLGPDARASIGGSLVLDCVVASPPDTTTTVPDDTTTTAPHETTTTVPDETTTTTTVTDDPTTTTTTTTTVPVADETTTTAPVQEIAGPLPATGPSGNVLALLLAVVCLAAGLALRSVKPAHDR